MTTDFKTPKRSFSWPFTSGRVQSSVLAATIAALLFVTDCRPVHAAVARAAQEKSEAEQEEPEQQVVFDLGRFQLKEIRPTRNETIKVTFTIHMVMISAFEEENLSILENSYHRLRDQAIIAVRTAHTNDFREPGLGRLRRLVQIRLNQTLKANATENLLISEYQFSLD